MPINALSSNDQWNCGKWIYINRGHSQAKASHPERVSNYLEKYRKITSWACYKNLIWKCFEWKHVKEAMPGHITNNQTEVKQATSARRKYNHTCDTPSWTCYKFLEEVQSVTSRACEKLIGKSAEHNIKSVWEVLWRSAERNIQIVLEVARKKCRAQHQDCVRQEHVPRTLHMTLIHHPTPSTERDRVRKSRGETEKHTKAGVVLSAASQLHLPRENIIILVIPLSLGWV